MKKVTFTSTERERTSHTTFCTNPKKEMNNLIRIFDHMKIDGFIEEKVNFHLSAKIPSDNKIYWMHRIDELSNFLVKKENSDYNKVSISGSSAYHGASIELVNKNHGGVKTVKSFNKTSEMLHWIQGYTDAIYSM